MRLTEEYFRQDALYVAKNLLGKFLCRNIDGKIIKLRITETECYMGKDDTASHASKCKTNRNQPMFKQGGCAYIYLCYGIHNLFNVVTGPRNSPQAVLIRGVENYNGPGKLTKALQINRNLNGVDLTKSKEIWLENENLENCNSENLKYEIIEAKRVGINYADQKDKERLWRFILKNK
ncbi:MAG: DNA-3-methyladenine glycosylase [Clostridia bacterium]|nr:DNA-3-methyladenine glycosylase [Clostridia bacterium]